MEAKYRQNDVVTQANTQSESFLKEFEHIASQDLCFSQLASAIEVLTSSIGVRVRRFFGFVLTAFPPAEAYLEHLHLELLGGQEFMKLITSCCSDM